MIPLRTHTGRVIPLRTHTVLGHLFSLEIPFFEILANFDVIFRGEAVEIAKLGGEYGKREFQELFKYLI